MTTKFNIFLFAALSFLLYTSGAAAQCSSTSAPYYSKYDNSEWYLSINASATGGGVSTINYSYTAGGEYGPDVTYINQNSQGVTAAPGATITVNLTKDGTYTDYQSLYVDWDNDGLFESNELVSSGLYSNTVSFVVPAGAVTGVNLPFRIFNSEGGSAPCNGTWGQTIDFYMNICSSPAETVTLSAAQLCLGATDTMVAAGASTYSWQPAIGLSGNTSDTGIAAPGTTTTYAVIGTVAGGCSDTDSVAVTVNPLVTPTVSIISNPGNTICAGTPVTFAAIPVNGGSAPVYQWSKNGVVMATDSTYTDNGLLNNDSVAITLTSNAACATINTVSDTTAITVNPLVTPTVSISANPGDTICAGTSVTFAAIPVNGGSAPVYQWSKNGIVMASSADSLYTDSGLLNNDSVAITLVSNVACATVNTISDTTAITVNPILIPTVSINANPGDTVCAGIPVIFTLTAANNGSAPAYQWIRNGSVVSTDAVYTDSTLNNNDQIICKLVSNATCAMPDSVSDTLTVNVHPLPIPVIAAANNVLGTGVNFVTYQWNDTAVIVGATGSTYTPTHDGSYTVTVTDSNGCMATSAMYNETTLGIANINGTGYAISIHPNPSSSIVYIEASVAVTADLSGIDGKLILHQENAKEINISNLPDGMYMMTIYNADRSIVKVEKVVKQ
jgi:hypothetical protein